MRNWTEAEYAEFLKERERSLPPSSPRAAKRSKYNARKKEIDNVTFDSTREAKVYQQLKLMQAAGEISDLQLQPKYVLQEGFRDPDGKWHRAIQYVADFAFLRPSEDKTCKQIAVDVKGFITPIFRLKEKMFREKFGEHISLEIWK
jgi:hypothetical protein